MVREGAHGGERRVRGVCAGSARVGACGGEHVAPSAVRGITRKCLFFLRVCLHDWRTIKRYRNSMIFSFSNFSQLLFQIPHLRCFEMNTC